MRYTTLVNLEGEYRTDFSKVGYAEAHSRAEHLIAEGYGVKVMQHGRFEETLCCESCRGELINKL